MWNLCGLSLHKSEFGELNSKTSVEKTLTHSRAHLSVATTRSRGSNGSRQTIHAVLTRRTTVSRRSLRCKITAPF